MAFTADTISCRDTAHSHGKNTTPYTVMCNRRLVSCTTKQWIDNKSDPFRNICVKIHPSLTRNSSLVSLQAISFSNLTLQDLDILQILSFHYLPYVSCKCPQGIQLYNSTQKGRGRWTSLHESTSVCPIIHPTVHLFIFLLFYWLY